MDIRTVRKLGLLGGGLLLVVLIPLVYGLLSGGGMQRVNLVMWSVFDDPSLYQGIIEEYQASNPGTTIAFTKKADFAELERDLVNELAEGKGPDIVVLPPDLLWKHRGKFASVPQSIPLGIPKTFQSVYPSGVHSQIIQKENNGESILGIPLWVDPLGIIYNQEYFLQNFASERPAELWDTFTENLLKVVRRNTRDTMIRSTPIALGRVDNIRRGVDILNLIMLQRGVTFYTPDMRSVTIDGAVENNRTTRTFPGIDALDYYLQFGLEGTETFTWSLEQTKTATKDDEVGAFVRGEIGMIFAYPYILTDMERLAQQYEEVGLPTIDLEQVRSAPVPQFSVNNKVAVGNYFTMVVPTVSPKKQQAFAFAGFLASEEVQRFLFLQGNKLSPRLDLLAEQAESEVLGGFAQQIGYMTHVLMFDADTIRTRYIELFKDLFAQTLDSTDALTQMKYVWQCALKEVDPNAQEPEEGCR